MQNNVTKPVISRLRESAFFSYLISVSVVAFVTLLCYPLSKTQQYYLVSFILLFAVFVMATFMKIGPVFLAAALSSLAWNYFFIPPHNTFHIEKTDDILMFVLFFSIAILNGILTSRIRRQEQLAIEREERTSLLFHLTQQLSKAGSIDEVLKIAIKETNRQFSVNVFFILQDGNNILYPSGRLQKDKMLSSAEYEVAEWCFRNGQEAGALTQYMNHVDCTFFPLPGNKLVPGVMVVKPPFQVSGEKRTFWLTFITQIANAIEREFLAEVAGKARLLDESGRLYKTLFNSISHEFRIPVATIMGASDSLLNSSHPVNVQNILSNEIFSASVRLNRLIENLLNMSRLESGKLSVSLDWCDINDLFNKVIDDLKDELEIFKVKVSIPDYMPLVKIDFGLMEQALYNLVFNSTQYANPLTCIELSSDFENNELLIVIKDEGPGFPEDAIEHLFTKFYRVNGAKPGGLGLGLSIVKGFVEAHSGKVSVENNHPVGSVFKIRIPTENADIKNLIFENNE